LAPSAGSNNAAISDLDLIAFPSGLGWSARLHNLDPDRDVLAVIWYALDSDWNVWRVLPALSGRIAGNAIAENGDRVYQFKSHLQASQQHTCLADGKYRAEIYLNGRMAGEKVTSLEVGSFAPSSFSDRNLAMCSPADWQSDQTHSLDPDLARAQLAPGGKRGALLFTYYNPRLESDDAVKERFMRKSAYILGQAITESPLDTDCAAYPKESGVKYVKYRQGNTAVFAKGWIVGDGFVHVGLVFDLSVVADHAEAHSWGNMAENCSALVSISNIY